MGAFGYDEPVIGSVLFRVYDGTVLNVHRHLLVEQFTGRHPVNGRHKVRLIRELKLASNHSLHCQADSDIIRHSTFWNSDMKPIALPRGFLLLAATDFQYCLPTLFYTSH